MNWLNWILFKLTDQRGEVGDDDPPTTDPPVDDPPPLDPPATDPPPPQYASADDVKQIKEANQTLNDTLQRIQGTIDALANSQSQPSAAPSAPNFEDVSDEAIDGVLNEGKGASQIRKAWKADMRRMQADLDSKIAELQNFGITTLSEHGEQLAESQMPYRNNPRVKNIIDSELAKARKSNPELLSSPRIVKSIHDRVVGENMPLMVQDAVDEALRKSREPVIPSNPSNRTVRQPNFDNPDDIPTVEEYLGKDAAQALSFKAQSPDDYAKSLRRGLRTWGDFVKWNETEKAKLTSPSSGRA